jgi:leader peptidase (prepilin peptidase)/N-methyltransferase
MARRATLALATAGLFALAAIRFEDDALRATSTAIFAALFLALAVTDLEHQLLPDKIVLPGLVAGLAVSPFLDHLSPWDGALGAAVGFLVFLPIWGWALLTGREGRIMGFGDVKFSAMMGAALGLQFLGVALYAGVLLGGVAAVLLLAGRLMAPRMLGSVRVMPYGTFLAIGGLIALFYGRPIVDRVIEFLA